MNKVSEKGAFISKSEAVMLQAVAVMLMVWHHLFGFPDRIGVPCVRVLDTLLSEKLPIELYLAYFGRICIMVFAFSSGYGMRKKTMNSLPTGILGNYKLVFRQLLKFFSRYWVVFFVFIPMGFLLKVYPVDGVQFAKGTLGVGAGYNQEWWYVASYAQVLLLFPLVTWLFDVIQKWVPVLVHIIMVSFVAVLFLSGGIAGGNGLMEVLVGFLVGLYFASNQLFEMTYRLVPKKSWIQLIVGVALFGIVFVLRFIGVPDYLLVALFVFSVMVIVKTSLVIRFVRPVLVFVGKYSTYIWLTHTFFGYYYFQKITFAPRYSWLIFLWCMALSIASGMVLEALLSLITKGTKKIFVRKTC